jgi:hypothetical protein
VLLIPTGMSKSFATVRHRAEEFSFTVYVAVKLRSLYAPFLPLMLDEVLNEWQIDDDFTYRLRGFLTSKLGDMCAYKCMTNEESKEELDFRSPVYIMHNLNSNVVSSLDHSDSFQFLKAISHTETAF